MSVEQFYFLIGSMIGFCFGNVFQIFIWQRIIKKELSIYVNNKLYHISKDKK